MDKCIEQWDTRALTLTHKHTTLLMLGSVCATLPDTAAYERVITSILWVLPRGYFSGGQYTAHVDVTVGFPVFRNFSSVPVIEHRLCGLPV